MFVHGGGFVAGDSVVPGTPTYDMVGRLGGQARLGRREHDLPGRARGPWPAGAEDVAAAVGWRRANIAAYGGDHDRIIVAGNSAGATHVADSAAGHGGDLAACAASR